MYRIGRDIRLGRTCFATSHRMIGWQTKRLPPGLYVWILGTNVQIELRQLMLGNCEDWGSCILKNVRIVPWVFDSYRAIIYTTWTTTRLVLQYSWRQQGWVLTVMPKVAESSPTIAAATLSPAPDNQKLLVEPPAFHLLCTQSHLDTSMWYSEAPYSVLRRVVLHLAAMLT